MQQNPQSTNTYVVLSQPPPQSFEYNAATGVVASTGSPESNSPRSPVPLMQQHLPLNAQISPPLSPPFQATNPFNFNSVRSNIYTAQYSKPPGPPPSHLPQIPNPTKGMSERKVVPGARENQTHHANRKESEYLPDTSSPYCNLIKETVGNF